MKKVLKISKISTVPFEEIDNYEWVHCHNCKHGDKGLKLLPCKKCVDWDQHEPIK